MHCTVKPGMYCMLTPEGRISRKNRAPDGQSLVEAKFYCRATSKSREQIEQRPRRDKKQTKRIVS